MAEMEDLQAPDGPPVAPLSIKVWFKYIECNNYLIYLNEGCLIFSDLLIKDPRDYFDSQQANALKALGDTGPGAKEVKCNVSTHDAYNSLKVFISQIKTFGITEPITNPDVALKVN